MSEQTEKLAEELNTVCTHTGWHGLSKHVQKLLILARIEEVQKLACDKKVGVYIPVYCIERMKELQKQLTEV